MPSQTAPCPSPEQLRALGRGELSAAEAAAVAGHVRECDACRAVTSDTLARAPAPADVSLGPTEAGATPPPGLPPALVDHPTYEVRRELGRGGMGVVYLARNKVMDRLEALKVLPEQAASRPGRLERFVGEIQAAARLQHPNIVTAYAAFTAGGVVVLAMEYVEGQSLAELVKRGGPLPLDRACDCARQVARGLARAHEEGMVHRDIKPHNLMLSRRGEVKVLDFGLAKLHSEEIDSALTGAGATLGTPDYMAPEQASDARSADIRADIYALGCTLYFLLTGRPPFAGLSPFEAMKAHQQQAPPPLGPGVPPALAALVARLMAKRADDRPQTPAEVADALAPFAEGAVGAAPPGRSRRRVWGLAGGVMAAAALAVALWAGGALSRPADGAGEDNPAAPTPPAARPAVEAKKPPAPPRTLTNSVGMKLVLVPRGEFLMGSPEGKGAGDEHPQRLVVITRPFFMGAYEVTQGEYREVMEANPSHHQAGAAGADKVAGRDTARFPVERVTHADAVEFCKRLSRLRPEKRAGRVYRLPSEAEWEYACRAGTTTRYAFGDDLSGKQANIRDELGRTEEVGRYPANGFGLFDMHGNVAEWCADWYDAAYYSAGGRTDPRGPAAGQERVARGGYYRGSATSSRSGKRGNFSPDRPRERVGFRVVMVPPEGG